MVEGVGGRPTHADAGFIDARHAPFPAMESRDGDGRERAVSGPEPEDRVGERQRRRETETARAAAEQILSQPAKHLWICGGA